MEIIAITYFVDPRCNNGDLGRLRAESDCWVDVHTGIHIQMYSAGEWAKWLSSSWTTVRNWGGHTDILLYSLKYCLEVLLFNTFIQDFSCPPLFSHCNVVAEFVGNWTDNSWNKTVRSWQNKEHRFGVKPKGHITHFSIIKMASLFLFVYVLQRNAKSSFFTLRTQN